MQREMMRDHFKKVEMDKLKLAAALKAAKKGEPLDPEMLNPVRKREKVSVSEEEEERRFLLVKEWSRYKMEQHKLELERLQTLMKSRDKALRELKKISLPLYNQALELNPTLFPFECQALTYTPPIVTYTPPDPDAWIVIHTVYVQLQSVLYNFYMYLYTWTCTEVYTCMIIYIDAIAHMNNVH